MRAIILARVSTGEQFQEGHSIPAQLAKMREYCAKHNLNVYREYSFDESSIKDHRTKFLQVLDEIKRSKEKIALVVETIDRLQRSFKESVALDELRKQNKVNIYFIRENLIITENSNSSELQRWDLGVFVARSYVLQISDNVKRSNKQKLEQGEWTGKAPIGYKNIVDKVTQKKTICVDKERAYLVQRLFLEYAMGNYSLATLQEFAKKIGLETKESQGITKSYLHRMLQNKFYIGIMTVKGVEYPHKYETFITKEIFNRCQAILDGRGNKRVEHKVKPAVFRGMLTCPECGRTMHVDFKKGKYVYFFCPNSLKSIGKCSNKGVTEEQVLLEQANKIFDNLSLPEYTAQKVLEYLKDMKKQEEEYNKESVESLRQEYDLLQKRIDALINLKIDSSAGISSVCITEEEYTKKMYEFRQRQHDLQNKMMEHAKADEKFNITLITVLELAKNAGRLFKSSSVDEKRQLLNLVCSNFTLREKNLYFIYKKPFDMLAKGSNRSKWLPE